MSFFVFFGFELKKCFRVPPIKSFLWHPSAQVSLGQEVSSVPLAPLTTQGLLSGGGGFPPTAHPPTPLGTPPPPLRRTLPPPPSYHRSLVRMVSIHTDLPDLWSHLPRSQTKVQKQQRLFRVHMT